MISRKRISLGIPLRSGGSDVALLFLAMKLVVSVPASPNQQDRLYLVAKQFAALLEMRGTISLPFLQALTLVALYEYSHAIYPAAWMTVGACSRYAEILGLPSARDLYSTLGPCVGVMTFTPFRLMLSRRVMGSRCNELTGRQTSWTEAEERRRVWWSILVLDRAIAIGSKRRLAVAEPSDLDILPMTDESWVRTASSSRSCHFDHARVTDCLVGIWRRL